MACSVGEDVAGYCRKTAVVCDVHIVIENGCFCTCNVFIPSVVVEEILLKHQVLNIVGKKSLRVTVRIVIVFNNVPAQNCIAHIPLDCVDSIKTKFAVLDQQVVKRSEKKKSNMFPSACANVGLITWIAGIVIEFKANY